MFQANYAHALNHCAGDDESATDVVLPDFQPLAQHHTARTMAKTTLSFYSQPPSPLFKDWHDYTNRAMPNDVLGLGQTAEAAEAAARRTTQN